MKALSIHQPWAHAILHLGKNIENRTWFTRHRGPLLIHAGKNKSSYTAWNAKEWKENYDCEFPPLVDLTFSAIVGVVDVVDCVPAESLKAGTKWAGVEWCWILANPVAFATPVPFGGKLGLFIVPDDTPGIEQATAARH